MTDYDIFIKELIDEATRPDGELHALARKCYEVGYERGLQEGMNRRPSDVKARHHAIRPGGLPGVTKAQVRSVVETHSPDTIRTGILAIRLAQWFNDPNRDAPAKHPEWTKASHETVVGGTFVSDDAIEQFVENIDPDRDAPVKPPTTRLLEERLGLHNLPDYETWFERHGSERTTDAFVVQPATVHELYTMFRARLLDELHRVGVIGVEGDKP